MVVWKDSVSFPAGTVGQSKFIDLSAMVASVASCDVGSCLLEMGLFGVAYAVVLGHPTEQEINGSSTICSLLFLLMG